MRRAYFIVIEGLDGAGKTTISKWLVEVFERNGRNAIYTYEPSDTKFVDALKSYKEYRTPELDALAYAADRLVHLRKVVIPALLSGTDVIMDRYYFSSIAYQGASGVPIEWVIEVNRYAIKPDLSIYIDVEPEAGLTRIKKGKSSSRFPEYEKIDLLRKVREIYMDMVNRGWLEYVDGNHPIEQVKGEVLSVINQKLRLGLRA